MNQHKPKLAGNSKDLPMGANMLSFHSFHRTFSEGAEFPCWGQIYKRTEQVGAHLGKFAGKHGAEAAGSRGLWRGWEEILFKGSRLFSCCQAAVVPQSYSADFFWRRNPTQICLPSALLKDCRCNLILLISLSLNKVYIYLLGLLIAHA